MFKLRKGSPPAGWDAASVVALEEVPATGPVVEPAGLQLVAVVPTVVLLVAHPVIITIKF